MAKEKLGWEPKIKLEEGLKQTVAYFESLLTKGSKEQKALSVKP